MSFEPRTTAWYQAAMLARERVFGNARVSAERGQLVVNLSQPVFDEDGGAAGVVATELHLQRLAEVLRTQRISARGAAAKLFAFGYDAWLITAYPEHLNGGREGSVRGATGDLRVDRDGNIVRVPGWSVFRQGQPVPLAER